MYQSQNNETEIVLSYFNERTSEIPNPCVLSIGENDGFTLSNSYDLIMCGWNAVLLEPSVKAFEKMLKLHLGNNNVVCLNYGIADESGTFQFHESGSYKHQGKDISLFSSLLETEKKRWGNEVEFEEVFAHFKTFEDFYNESPYKKFDYITIDAEGFDWYILKQIDLEKVNCQLLCIEHNGISHLIEFYRNYGKQFGLSEISINPENILLAKI